MDSSTQKFYEWIKTKVITKTRAIQLIRELKTKILKLEAQGQAKSPSYSRSGDGERALGRYEMAMDRISEQIDPLQNQIDLLRFWHDNPTKRPPTKLIEEFNRNLSYKDQVVQRKKERQVTLTKYPSLIGKKITWKSVKNRGQMMSAIVIKQTLGRDDKPRYKCDNGWTVPHRLIKNVSNTSKGQQALEQIQQKKEQQKSLLSNLKGKTIRWNSRKLYDATGKVVAVGRTKVKVYVKETMSTWTVPVALITTVNGKKI